MGAGPGAADLVTVRGLDRIRRADVVVYDDLVDEALLAEAPDGAELLYAGKRGWREGPERPDTGELLVRRAREGGGKRVVRLKGGDPMVFGRGGEEAAALVSAAFTPDERVLESTLVDVPAAARSEAIASPALLVIGEVAAHRSVPAAHDDQIE